MDLVAAMASATGPVSDDSAVQDHALSAVRALLKDPNSAQFRDVRIQPYQDGKVVCGEVNAKNSYGGYVGFTLFVAGIGVADLYYESEYVDIERAANAGLLAACKS